MRGTKLIMFIDEVVSKYYLKVDLKTIFSLLLWCIIKYHLNHKFYTQECVIYLYFFVGNKNLLSTYHFKSIPKNISVSVGTL